MDLGEFYKEFEHHPNRIQDSIDRAIMVKDIFTHYLEVMLRDIQFFKNNKFIEKSSGRNDLERFSSDKFTYDLERFTFDTSDNVEYELIHKETVFHRYGDGGHGEILYLLRRDRRIVLLTRYLKTWWTSMDDYDDLWSDEIKKTYLIEDDPVAKEVFENVK